MTARRQGPSRWVAAGLLAAVVAVGCGGLKLAALKGTSLPNPPVDRVRVFVREFPVTSKAGVLERRSVVGGGATEQGSSSISALADVGTAIMEISRPCRIEDISGAVLRELRRDSIRVFVDIVEVEDLSDVRLMPNPFLLVPMDSGEAQLEIDGTALIRSQRVSKEFSPLTTGVELAVGITDLQTGIRFDLGGPRTHIRMLFNSKELEEAMAIAVVTRLNQKTLF